jgi:hypothetical protein
MSNHDSIKYPDCPVSKDDEPYPFDTPMSCCTCPDESADIPEVDVAELERLLSNERGVPLYLLHAGATDVVIEQTHKLIVAYKALLKALEASEQRTEKFKLRERAQHSNAVHFEQRVKQLEADNKMLAHAISEKTAVKVKQLEAVIESAPHDSQCVVGKITPHLFDGGHTVLKCNCWKSKALQTKGEG